MAVEEPDEGGKIQAVDGEKCCKRHEPEQVQRRDSPGRRPLREKKGRDVPAATVRRGGRVLERGVDDGVEGVEQAQELPGRQAVLVAAVDGPDMGGARRIDLTFRARIED